MFRKYEKTFRILTPTFNVRGKYYLSDKDKKALLNGTVEITEKIDGANVAIVRGNKQKWTLQKRRGLADEGSHAQFSFFWNWARYNVEKILNIPSQWVIYGELCFVKHTIEYDQLPSYFLVFDIWNGQEYIRPDKRLDMSKSLGFAHVPVLYYDHLEDIEQLESMIGQSNFSGTSLMEGLVVKNWRKQMRGKIVRPEFIKEMEDEDHWMKQPLKKQKLKNGLEWYA